ncbi:hypothetical protein E2C01_012358 [Portunus trituberculatus]|uniref:Uncharacterized protein n=1 Tax=Portunus trituberculatus TaxID=210409 RepID=A0A5B7DDW0_PORTR|nr:hypothetical protein [Portunus trituberculatus]
MPALERLIPAHEASEPSISVANLPPLALSLLTLLPRPAAVLPHACITLHSPCSASKLLSLSIAPPLLPTPLTIMPLRPGEKQEADNITCCGCVSGK